MKTLYVYKINREKGIIEKHTIEKYEALSNSYRYDHIFTGTHEGSFVAYKKNLDVVINDKLHTFNSNEVEVRNKIKKYIFDKYQKAQKETELWENIWFSVK